MSDKPTTTDATISQKFGAAIDGAQAEINAEKAGEERATAARLGVFNDLCKMSANAIDRESASINQSLLDVAAAFRTLGEDCTPENAAALSKVYDRLLEPLAVLDHHVHCAVQSTRSMNKTKDGPSDEITTMMEGIAKLAKEAFGDSVSVKIKGVGPDGKVRDFDGNLE